MQIDNQELLKLKIQLQAVLLENIQLKSVILNVQNNEVQALHDQLKEELAMIEATKEA